MLNKSCNNFTPNEYIIDYVFNLLLIFDFLVSVCASLLLHNVRPSLLQRDVHFFGGMENLLRSEKLGFGP